MVTQRLPQLRAELDLAVKLRNPSAVNLLAKKLIRIDGGSETRIFVSECYRRLSHYSLALEVLKWDTKTPDWSRLTSDELRLRIQTARILNLLGASNYALSICDQLPNRMRMELKETLAPLYLSNYQYRDAFELSADRLETKPEKWTYTQRIRSLVTTDSLAGLGRREEALDGILRIISVSREPLLLGICYQAAAEYAIRAKKLARSKKYLHLALKYFSPEDHTNDYGNLHKTFAELYSRSGETDLAQHHLKIAMNILYRKGVKPEPWLELLYWKGTLSSAKKFPIEWQRLLVYPSPHAPFTDWIKTKVRELPPDFQFNTRPYQPPAIEIDLKGSTKKLIEGKKISQKLGLRLADRLLSLLIAAESYGLPQFRIQETLWPDELLSQRELLKRLEQIVLELRSAGYAVIWKDHHLCLVSARSPTKIYWRMNQVPKGVNFLEQHLDFTRMDVENFFCMSKNSARLQCVEWLKTGAVKLQGVGKQTRYHSLHFNSV